MMYVIELKRKNILPAYAEIKEYANSIKEVEDIIKGFKNNVDVYNSSNCDIVKISKYRKSDGCTFDITDRFIDKNEKIINETTETKVENETTETLIITDEKENTYTTDEMFETIDNIKKYDVKTFKVGNGNNSIIIRAIGNETICLILWDNWNDKIIDYVEFFSNDYKNLFKKWLKYIV